MRFVGRRGTRSIRPLWLVLAAGAAGFVGCLDSPNGPGGAGPGFVALQPVFSSQIQSGHFALGVDTVGLRVRRPGTGELVVDTLFGFDPDSTSLHLALPIGMVKPVEAFDVHLTLQDGALVLFGGGKVLELRQGPPGTNAIDSIHVDYEGPGKNIAQLAIAPSDTVLTWGDSTRFNVQALDSSGAPVPQFFVSWSVSDTTTGRLDAFGKLRAPRARGVVTLGALTPNGVSAAAHVTFIPRPTRIELAGPDSVWAPVGGTISLVARVVAADSLGVLGLPVHFTALTPGGAVRDTVVISDSLGRAATQLVVGDTLRDYGYAVSVDTLRPVRRTVRAVAGPPAAVGIVAGNAQLGQVGVELPRALAVRVADAYGNPVRGQRVNFVVTAGGGSVYGGSSNTSDSGYAYERWTLGPSTAAEQRLEARAVDNVTGEPLLFATFSATAVAGPPAQLAFVSQPTGVVAGETLPTVQVAVRDSFGNVVATAGDTVRLALVGAAGGTLAGPTSAIVNEGVASFAGLSVSQAATGYALRAQAGSLAPATSAAFTVAPAAPASVAVSASDTVLVAVGAQEQLAVVLRDAFGNLVTGLPVAWSSGDTTVATVDDTGRVTARRNGTVRITAIAGGSATGFVDLTVRQAVTQLTATAPAESLTALGDTLRLTAVARDANGNPVAGAVVGWASSDPAVASVDPAGLVTARANGSVTITASAGASVAATVPLRVAQAVTTVQLTPQQTTLTAVGATVQLELAALDANGFPVTDASVAWSSSDTSVAQVSGGGLVTATGPGQVTITATLSGNVVQTVTLGVQVSVALDVQAIVVAPAADTLAALGATVTLAATARNGQGAAVSGLTFTWASSNPAAASVNAAGVVTAVGNGSATITASAAGVSGTARVTVAQAVARVAVTPATDTLALGQSVTLAAAAYDALNNVVAGASFAWASADPAVASVTAGGVVTAVAGGATTITATSGGVSGSAGVWAVVGTDAVTSVTVAPAGVTLHALGGTEQLAATARDAAGNVVAGTTAWASADEAVATVDADGLVTAVGDGAAQVTATVNGVSGAARVTVSQTVATVTVAPNAVTLTASGATTQLAAAAADANGHPVAGAAFTWQTTDPTVATVSSTGAVTAVGNGTATVSAASGGVTGSARVTVSLPAPPEPPRLATLVVSPTTVTFGALGATAQLAVQALDQYGQAMTGVSVTWASSNPAAASVSAAGVVTALANGTATVTASSGAVSATAAVRVAQVAAALTVAPRSVTLDALGSSTMLAASVTDANGYAMPAAVTWETSDAAVATVTSAGSVTAVGQGTAVIRAAQGGVSDSATVTVALAGPQRVIIDIKPGFTRNSINLGSTGQTPVAILTTSTAKGEAVTFDATMVVVSSVRFAGAAPTHAALEDVDGDGDLDLILQFDTQQLQLTPESTTATLTGLTTGGRSFLGQDSVVVVKGS